MGENIKTERYDGYYSDGRKRPGIKPKIPDEELSPEERHHREKRRLRNKEAASRCRKKKEAQITELQDNANDLKLNKLNSSCNTSRTVSTCKQRLQCNRIKIILLQRIKHNQQQPVVS